VILWVKDSNLSVFHQTILAGLYIILPNKIFLLEAYMEWFFCRICTIKSPRFRRNFLCWFRFYSG